MATTPFNALGYARLLREADVPEKQAEAEAEALWKVLEERDKAQAEQAQALAAVQIQLKNQQESHDKTTGDMATKADIALVRKDMEALGNKLIIRLTVIMGALIGLALAVQRYLPLLRTERLPGEVLP